MPDYQGIRHSLADFSFLDPWFPFLNFPNLEKETKRAGLVCLLIVGQGFLSPSLCLLGVA